jgi:hypothetical protein
MRAGILTLVTYAALAIGVSAQDGRDERLGTVHFATSCEPAVTAEFDRAVALLHSFEFGPAIAGFDSVLAADANCAMAYWGLALSAWTNPMVPSNRPAAALERGRAAVEEGARLAARASQRERDYIASVGELFRDHERVDQPTRVSAYARAMRELAGRYPDDDEAKIFHALALTASALPTDKTYANQLEAGRILEELLPTHLDHPGLTHYIIHTYDVPALAAHARPAALRYADIAPSAAHALHMPSRSRGCRGGACRSGNRDWSSPRCRRSACRNGTARPSSETCRR